MLKTEETTATEVFLHAADHGDRPVIHGAEIDYDDVHDGVRYHADLLQAASKALSEALKAEDRAAVQLAIRVSGADEMGIDPREYSGFAEHLADYQAAVKAGNEALARLNALNAKVDQDAAMATYGVPA